MTKIQELVKAEERRQQDTFTMHGSACQANNFK
jgi:hypothetical protein